MKLLSFTPSMSSSSTASFDANISTSSKSATAGCFAGILRLILCSRSLPTHPSDQITEAGSVVCEKHQELDKVEDKVMPSLVARLMGLESIPNVTPNTITRSRSMNSLDFKESSDDNKQHRRVKSTLSFREMPTSLEIENEEFFVLSFGSASEDKEKRSRRRKCDMGYGESKQRRGEKCKNKDSRAKCTEKKSKGNQGMKKKVSEVLNANNLCSTTSNNLKDSSEKPCLGLEILECSTPTKQNEETDGTKLRNKKKKVKSVELECSSEDSSPVSVLDFDQFIISELEFNLVESNSRRKLSPEPQNYECQSQRNDNTLMSTLDHRKTKKSQGKCVGSRNKHSRSEKFLDICDQVCKMTEAEVAESNWLHRMNSLKHEDFEDIYADLELQILNQSLDELVHQLIGLPM